jgi:DNA-3-methyladenine glycosylase II
MFAASSLANCFMRISRIYTRLLLATIRYMSKTFEKQLQEAAEYLKKTDLVLAPIIGQFGLASIRPHRNYYEALVGEIIAQQLSVKAAASIHSRFIGLFGDTFPAPTAILEKDIEELRSAGLSRAKASYIHDLAEQVVADNVRFDELDGLDDAAIITKLTSIKGIGEWTAHMFLMFCIGRVDVLAFGDLGIRVGIRELYKLDTLPTPDEVKEIARNHTWHPYQTVACWYIWAARDNKPEL